LYEGQRGLRGGVKKNVENQKLIGEKSRRMTLLTRRRGVDPGGVLKGRKGTRGGEKKGGKISRRKTSKGLSTTRYSGSKSQQGGS